MQKIHRVFLLLLIFLLILTATNTLAKKTNLQILTTFYPIYITTINITKDIPNITVKNMAPPVGCLHDYQLRPNDINNIMQADVLIINGFGLENFLNHILAKKKNQKIINASEGIEKINDNPHSWVSINNVIKQTENIANYLIKIDPENANNYKKNADIYIEKLKILFLEFKTALNNIPTRKIITYHDSFAYLARDLNLQIVATVTDDPDAPLTAKRIVKIINIAKENNIRVIFSEPQYSKKAVEIIAKENNMKIYSLNPATTGEYILDAYLNIMHNNLEILKNALKRDVL